jgi:hypothetical protein
MALANKPLCIPFWVGENDAYDGTKADSVKTDIIKMQDSLAKDLGYRPIFFIVRPGQWTPVTNIDTMSQKIAACVNDTNRYLGACAYAVTKDATLHIDDGGRQVIGQRIADVIAKYLLGTIGSGYRGPRIDSMSAIGRGQVRAYIKYGLGTTCVAAGRSNFEFQKSTGVRIFNLGATGGANVDINISDREMSGTLQYHYAYPDADTAQTVKDNNGLPMEPNP